MPLYTAAMAIFLITAAAILFGSHFFVYSSIIDFFKVPSGSARAWLAALLFALGTSYIAASILSHISENAFTRSLYYAAGLWLGIVSNLFFAFLIARLVFAAAKFLHFEPDAQTFGAAAVVLALAVSIYGAWNAHNQTVKNITVKIKDLPAEWEGKTAVQISDLHIGHVFGEKFLEKVVDMVNSAKPEIVFITGDLFDGMDGNYDTRILPLNGIEAPRGAYFITGNHETYFGVDNVRSILAGTDVKALDDAMIDMDGLQIVGASYPEKGQTKDIAGFINSLSGFDKGRPSILLYHSPTHIEEAKAAGIDLQLSGHTHKGQIFPYNLITRLVYRGYDYGLRTEGDFNIYTTNGTGAWGPTMRIGNTPEIVAIRLEAK